jgi:hypothetical protein
MRPIGLGRRTWLFAGGGTLDRAMTLIGTAKRNGLEPRACHAFAMGREPWRTLACIRDRKAKRLDAPLPRTSRPTPARDLANRAA